MTEVKVDKKRPARKKTSVVGGITSSGQVRIAEEFAKRYEHKLIHIDRIGWHQWVHSHWKLAPDKLAVAYAQRLLKKLLQEAVIYEPDVRDQWLQDIRRCESANGLLGVTKIAAGMDGIAVDAADVDNQPDLVAFTNVTYDLRSDEVMEPDPAHYITKVMGAEYKPDATCPAYDKMLSEAQPNPVMRAYLHRLVGMAMEGRVREHAFPVMCGSGGNGKGSTLNDAWLPVFGDYGVALNVEVLTSKGDKDYVTERLALKGARYVVTSEPKAGSKFNAALLKLLAGGDRMSVRPLFSNQTVNWAPTHSIYMMCNFRPDPPADDGGVWRRLKPVDWLYTVPEEEMDRDLPQKLRGEADGIAQRILAGWRDFRDNGLGVPEESKRLAEEWRSEVDALGRFLEERCVVDKARKDYRTKSSSLFVKWASFCHDLNEDAGNNKSLTLALKRRGFTFQRTSTGIFAQGVAMVDSERPQIPGM